MSLVERMSTICLCWADMAAVVLAGRYESMRWVCMTRLADWENEECVEEEIQGL
jgi:hypothetical protein